MESPTLYRVNSVVTVSCWVNAHAQSPQDAKQRVEKVLQKRLTNFFPGATITIDDFQTVEVVDARS